MDKLATYLEKQIADLQLQWMENYTNGDDVLRAQVEVVLDGIYAFREFFLDVPPPAQGQGYQPPDEAWDEVVKQRKLDEIDAQISELIKQREAITGE